MHSSEYVQANSFVAVFMVDFAPFSAVLLNCQFYRLKVFLEAKIGQIGLYFASALNRITSACKLTSPSLVVQSLSFEKKYSGGDNC